MLFAVYTIMHTLRIIFVLVYTYKYHHELAILSAGGLPPTMDRANSSILLLLVAAALTW